MRIEDHPYAEFLHRVEKPARYVGGEYRQRVKPGAVRSRMVLAFPDVYDIGMSHLGTRILYAIVNAHPELALERAFCPWPDAEHEIRARGLPLLTLESATALSETDVVGFSLQYELTYTNVLTMLDLGGIPLRAADRADGDPLVIAGGPGATQPEPMAPFFDLFLIGDAEERLPELLLRDADLREAGAPRRERLVELAKLGGLYAPALYGTRVDERTGLVVVDAPLEDGVPERVERVTVEDLSRYPFPDDGPVANAEAIFDRMGIEIARGCTEGCRFCQAGMIYRPVRERDPEELIETILRAVRNGGYDEVGLTTLSTADYSCISPLVKEAMRRLRREKVSLSVASLRAYGLDEDLLDEIRSVRATGLTFAPEAGTQRLRDVINKNVSDEDMERTAERVFRLGWRRMKLYFMIGLPTETDEDLRGILETGTRMREIGCRFFKPGAVGVTVSVSSHVPKPHTPFQWCAFDSMEDLARKQGLLEEEVRGRRLDLRTHNPRVSFLECLLGRGDRRMADVVEDAWRSGARFDSWDDRLRWDVWTEVLGRHEEIPIEQLVGTFPVDATLPWDHLDIGIEKRFLAKEYRQAMKGRASPPCGKPVGLQTHHTNLEEHDADGRKLVCYACGVECDLSAMREERGGYLRKLGAVEAPRRTAEPEGVTTGRTDPRGRPPHDFRQGDPVRYRLHLDRLPPATLVGHLDWIRALPRILRRAGLPLFYSEGFHPKPKMEFPPALPLGTTSLDEAVDIALTEERDPEEVLAALREAAPEGIAFRTVLRREVDAKRLNRQIAVIEWIARLRGPEGDHADAPARLLARESIPWTVTRRRRPKEVDLRPALEDVRWVEASELPERLAGFRRDGDRWLRIRILDDLPGIHGRPEEMVAAMLEDAPRVESADLARVGLLAREGDVLVPLAAG
jgi:radical SAM family uncharacterized protein/radical SAM-linked protein